MVEIERALPHRIGALHPERMRPPSAQRLLRRTLTKDSTHELCDSLMGSAYGLNTMTGRGDCASTVTNASDPTIARSSGDRRSPGAGAPERGLPAVAAATLQMLAPIGFGRASGHPTACRLALFPHLAVESPVSETASGFQTSTPVHGEP